MNQPQQVPTHVCKNCSLALNIPLVDRGKTLTLTCCDKPSPMLVKYESQDSLMKRIALQNAEFDAVAEVSKQYGRIQLTPVVDDDYPIVRECYELAVSRLIAAMKKNGRQL